MKGPDVAWVSKERWDKLTLQREKIQFPKLVPDFVIELQSETDNFIELKNKMSKWVEKRRKISMASEPTKPRNYCPILKEITMKFRSHKY